MTHSFPTRRSSDLLGMSTRQVRQLRDQGSSYVVSLDQLMNEPVSEASAPWEAPDPHERNDPAAATDNRAMLELLSLAIDSLRSEEHTSELQSLMRISYAAFCLKKNKK